MRLRILTYNIHKGVGTDRAYRLDRIADVVRHYAPAVIALQEVTFAQDGENPPQPRAIAAALGMRHGVVALNCRRRQCVYGNMTMSRLPFEDHANVDLSIRFKKPRAALYTRIALRDGPLHFFNVHLGLARFERTIQMRDLVEQAEDLAPQGQPVVIAGDTNDWQHTLYARVLSGAGFACVTGDATDPGHATFPSWYPMGALDKVFSRGDVVSVRAYPSRLALARVASDHLPVIADLEIRQR